MKKIGIIGAGASGLYAALHLKNENNDVTILEKNDTIGKKLLMTGNGRCNLTNASYYDDFLEQIVTNKKFIYSAFAGHDNFTTIDFFENNGLKTVVEDKNRVFPASQKAMDVLKFFEKQVVEKNIRLVTGSEVVDISKGEKFLVKTKDRTYDFDYLIIATGGLSYPNTGSKGDGYKFARKFGHTITKTYPSLVPIFFKDRDLADIRAINLENVLIKVETDQDSYYNRGSVLLTKSFITGPSVLNLSAYIVNKKIKSISLDLTDIDDLEKYLLDLFDKNPSKDIGNVLIDLVKKALVSPILARANIRASKKSNQITRDERKCLAYVLKNFTLDFDHTGSFNTAVITKGGISVKEINPKTMESRLADGLYFIGEVLDIDALTGGYNLQLAFTSAFAAARAIKEKI